MTSPPWASKSPAATSIRRNHCDADVLDANAACSLYPISGVASVFDGLPGRCGSSRADMGLIHDFRLRPDLSFLYPGCRLGRPDGRGSLPVVLFRRLLPPERQSPPEAAQGPT